MFEREIKFIYDFNINKVNKLGPYFTFEQLISSEVHPAILHYISAEIDYLIFEDRQKLLKNSMFDYSGEKITMLFSQIGEEVKKNKRFALEYITKLILHASSFTINFLVRPKWTLIKFIYDEGNHKTTTEIKQILNYLYYYKYLKKIIVSYINTKKIISMNSSEFTELMDKVDQLGSDTYLHGILSNSLKSMAEFFNIGEVQKNKIPLNAVQMLLEEKQLTKHLEKIKYVFGDDKNAKFNFIEYQKELDSVMIEKEEFLPEDSNQGALDSVIEEEIIPVPEPTEAKEEEVNVEESLPEDEEVKTADETDLATVVEEEIIPEQETAEVENKDSEVESTVTENKDVEKEDELDFDSFIVRTEKIEDEIAEEEPAEEESEKEDFVNKSEKEETVRPPEKKLFRFKFRFGKSSENKKVEQEQVEEISETEDNVVEDTGDSNTDYTEVFEENIVQEPDENETEKTEDVLEENSELIEPQEIEKDKFEELESEIDSKFEEREGNEDLFEEEEKVEEIKDVYEPSSDLVENIDAYLESKDKEDILEPNESVNAKEETIEDKLNDEDHEKEAEEILNEDAEINSNADRGVDDEGPSEKSIGDTEGKIDLAELLERKEMTKIIEVIFDYDIEEFSNTLDEIVGCKSYNEAIKIIDKSLKQHGISRKSKEAEAFTQIISEYFDH